MRRRAFTLIEVCMVVLLIGMLMAIAVPQWLNTRSRSQQRTCLSQLRAISGAKEQLAMESGLATGAVVTGPDLQPYLKGAAMPICPAGGFYNLEPIGTTPTCSLAALVAYPHILP